MFSPRTNLVKAGTTLAVAALLAAGCSSSKSSPVANTTGGTTGSTAGSSTSSSSAATGSSSSAAPGGDQPSDTASAIQSVKDTYAKFFDNSTDAAAKAALVQNASQVQGLIEALGKGANGAKSSIQVTGVTFSSATHANVTFAILLNGATALPSASGDALFDAASGKWQVADSTLCKLGAITPGVTPDILKAAGCS